MRTKIIWCFILAMAFCGEGNSMEQNNKYNLMVTSCDGSWGDYPLLKMDAERIRLLNDTPFDGVGVMGCDIYTGSVIQDDEIFINKSLEIKKELKKDLWIRVNLNRMIERKESHKVKKDAEYFKNIKGLDLDNSAGAKEDYLRLFSQALKIAKATSSPGVIMDLEPYHDYAVMHVDTLAQRNNCSIDKVIEDLRALGFRMADIAEKENPTVKLLTLFDHLETVIHVVNGRKYRDAAQYLIEAMLVRAKSKNIPLQIILGGEDNIGYMNKSPDELRERIKRRARLLLPTMERFNKNLILGSTITVWDDPKKLSAWTKEGIDEDNIYKSMEDFTRNFKVIYENYEFLWIYVPTCTDYNPYAGSTSQALNDKLRNVIANAQKIRVPARMTKLKHPLSNVEDIESSIKEIPSSELQKHHHLYEPKHDGTPKVKTLAWIMYDDYKLYIVFKCFEPNIGNIKKEKTLRDSSVHHDDCVEVFIDPSLSGRYCHFVVNPIGTIADAVIIDGQRDLTWDSNAKVTTIMFSDHWMARIEIPLGDFHWTENNYKMGINLCRERMPATKEEELSSLAVLNTKGFHSPDKFLVADVSDSILATFNIEKVDPGCFINGENNFSVVFQNKTAKERRLVATLKLMSDDDKATKFESNCVVEKNTDAFIRIPYRCEVSKYSRYELTVAENGNVIFREQKPVRGVVEAMIGGSIFYSGETIPVEVDLCLPTDLEGKSDLRVDFIKEGKVVNSERLKNLCSGKKMFIIKAPENVDGNCAINFSSVVDNTPVYSTIKEVEFKHF